MSSVHILLLSSGILGILYFVLSAAVIRQRGKTKTMLGDGAGEPEKAALLVAVRRHGNFAEYVPLSLVLLFFMVSGGAGPALTGVLCGLLVAARVSHPLGLGKSAPNALRAFGTIGNFLVLLVASCVVIADAL